MKTIIVFVHGWSVTSLDTYGELPARLQNEGAARGIEIQVKEIFLGKYVSFRDEVRLNDISKAFGAAVQERLNDVLKNGDRFVCVTHSTGGPVIRYWWNRYYKKNTAVCPMSHLIMLAPANHGSALAQLGKARLGRIKAWFEDVEPGQGVLDWLELGSAKAWELNKDWIFSDGSQIDTNGVFPFVLTGQSIDRSLYDNLNSYTGEPGSDGVVRVTAANLEARHVKLTQSTTIENNTVLITDTFKDPVLTESPKTPLRILAKKSHSGMDMGIMKSVKKEITENDSSVALVEAIFDCIKVRNKEDYLKVYDKFAKESALVQQEELVEPASSLFSFKRHFIHDRFSMVIFRVMDSEGYAASDFDLLLTAGDNDDPNHLPEGFLADRQRNRLNPEIITYYFNYNIMTGDTLAISKDDGKIIREKSDGIKKLGLRIIPRPNSGFVRYRECIIKAKEDLFKKALNPNSTTLVEITLHRIVSKNVFSLEDTATKNINFKNTEPDDFIV